MKIAIKLNRCTTVDCGQPRYAAGLCKACYLLEMPESRIRNWRTKKMGTFIKSPELCPGCGDHLYVTCIKQKYWCKNCRLYFGSVKEGVQQPKEDNLQIS